MRPYIDIKIPTRECRNGTYDSQCITTAEYDLSINTKYLIQAQNLEKFD